MNKYNLTEALAEELGKSKAETVELLKTFRNTIVSAVQAGHKVRFHDFGTFELKTSAPRQIKSIMTQQPICVPEKKRIGFVMSRNLKNTINS